MRTLLLALLLIPSIASAELIKSTSYLIEYFDSDGSVGTQSAPSSVVRFFSVRWNFSKNRKGQWVLKNGRLPKIICSVRGNELRCPYSATFSHAELGLCQMKQNHILRAGSRGATTTTTQDISCPDVSYGAYTKYVGRVVR